MNWVKGIPPRYMRDHMGMFTGGENRLGWHGEMDRCWIRKEDGVCVSSRLIRTDFGLIEHVTLTRSVSEAVKGNYGFSWAEKQEIKNELFGEERLVDSLNKCKASGPEELLPHIKADIDEFVGDAPQFDDITMLAFRYNGR